MKYVSEPEIPYLKRLRVVVIRVFFMTVVLKRAVIAGVLFKRIPLKMGVIVGILLIRNVLKRAMIRRILLLREATILRLEKWRRLGAQQDHDARINRKSFVGVKICCHTEIHSFVGEGSVGWFFQNPKHFDNSKLDRFTSDLCRQDVLMIWIGRGW